MRGLWGVKMNDDSDIDFDAYPEPTGDGQPPQEASEPQAEPEDTRLEEPEPVKVELWPAPTPTYTYLAGAAGSGKTFATKAWQEQTGRRLLLCATTGIAAINLGGSTINSILGYFDTKSLQDAYTDGKLTARLGKLYRAGVRRLILDEVSMLDGDQLTYLVRAIEETNNRGYVLDKQDADEWTAAQEEGRDREEMGLTLVGDFCQLPPVKAPFAFESPEWSRFAEHTITLTEIRRQADPDFIAALRAARQGNARTVAEYFGGTLQIATDDTFPGPTIMAKNESVDRYNWLRMEKLTGKDVLFTSSRWGKQRSEWGNPTKPPATWGIPERLRLRIGSLVMILANRRYPPDEGGGYAYVNGDLGILEEAEGQLAHVRLQRTGASVMVLPVTRQVLVPCDAARRKELRDLGQTDRISDDGKWEIEGEITYLPLRLAYATTVHKAQGLSLDQVQVNIRDHFFKTPGMLYVALSRARNAAGLRIVGTPAGLIERCTVDPRLKGYL